MQAPVHFMVAHKKCSNFTLWQLRQMWTDFNNPFTAAFRDKLQIKLEQNLPPHFKSDATLPWEIWIITCRTL